jgi:hypothetical protein
MFDRLFADRLLPRQMSLSCMSNGEETVPASLSVRGLQNIAVEEEDFTFFFEGSEEFRCSRFKAQFLSPTVSLTTASIRQPNRSISC